MPTTPKNERRERGRYARYQPPNSVAGRDWDLLNDNEAGDRWVCRKFCDGTCTAREFWNHLRKIRTEYRRRGR